MARTAMAVLLALCATPWAVGQADAVSGAVQWRSYDANGDGRLDEADTAIVFGAGVWCPTVDVNLDGQKDSDDYFALVVLKTKWDTNADMRVGDSDFAAQEPLSLPEPDAAAAASLASALLVESAAKLPPGQEERLMQEWPTFGSLPPPQQACLFEEAGVLALVERNLDVAQWAFAQACGLDPKRASALSNLGYTLCEQGRGAEALTLLSRAREMNLLSAPTSSTIGWAFARTGQLVEAERFYREATALAPQTAQYQLNLGVVLLRAGNDEGARQAFARAAELNPGDREALMMSVATDPAQPADLASYEAEYGRFRDAANKEMVESGMEPGQLAWEELSISDRIDEIIRQEADRVRAQRDAALETLAQETKDRLEAAVEPIRMRGESASADWERYWAGVPAARDAWNAVMPDAKRRARLIATDYERRTAAAILRLDDLILHLALSQAQIDMVEYQDGDDARRAFEATVDQMHAGHMRAAAESLQNAREDAALDLSPVDKETLEVALMTWMAIVTTAEGDLEYGKSFEPDAKPGMLDKLQFRVDDEPTRGVSIGVVGVEWKPDSDEVKLQVGQGIIVAGTWSPKRGFGFQLGLGLSIAEGPYKLAAAHYVKFGSDGSITLDYKVGAAIGDRSPEVAPDDLRVGLRWGGTMSVPLQAATHEPVGTW